LLLDCLQEGKCRTRNDGRPSNQKKMMKIVLNMKCASQQTKEIKLIERQQKKFQCFFLQVLTYVNFFRKYFSRYFSYYWRNPERFCFQNVDSEEQSSFIILHKMFSVCRRLHVLLLLCLFSTSRHATHSGTRCNSF